jgi:hypothetical protein
MTTVIKVIPLKIYPSAGPLWFMPVIPVMRPVGQKVHKTPSPQKKLVWCASVIPDAFPREV